MRPIKVIGVGPGGPDYLLPVALEAAAACPVWAGAGRAVEVLTGKLPAPDRIIDVRGSLDAVVRRIDAAAGEGPVAVLVTGDPLLYSLFARLHRDLGPEKIEVIPGISSVQIALSRLGVQWREVAICSAHGRDPEDFLLAAAAGGPFIALTDDINSPVALAGLLVDEGLGHRRAVVLDSLGYPDEEVVAFDSADALASEENRWSNALLFVEGRGGAGMVRPAYFSLTPSVSRLRDDDFVRGEAPISKEEVRLLVASKLDPAPKAIVYDVGAGTGSVTVELARRALRGKVFAIEKNLEGAFLVRANAEKFGLTNIEVVEGEAPAALGPLPQADAIFIGGSGPDIEGLVAACAAKLGDGGRLAATAVTLDKPGRLTAAAKSAGLHLEEALLMQISRAAGDPQIYKGENPIHILVFSKRSTMKGK